MVHCVLPKTTLTRELYLAYYVSAFGYWRFFFYIFNTTASWIVTTIRIISCTNNLKPCRSVKVSKLLSKTVSLLWGEQLH